MFQFAEQRSCQLCGGEKQRPFETLRHFREKQLVWSDLEFRYVICEGCGFVFMNPMPTAASYQEFYENAYWSIQTSLIRDLKQQQIDEARVEEGIQRSRENLRRRRLPRISAMLDERLRGMGRPARVLEIGCAWGAALEYFHQIHGAEVYGVEPSVQAVEFMRRDLPFVRVIGSKAEDLFEETPYDGTFDVVVLSHCLEMIVEQRRALQSVHRILAPGGAIYVDTPNFYWQRALNPAHPYVYMPDTMRSFLGVSGFRVASARHAPDPAGAFWKSMQIYRRSGDPYVTVLAEKCDRAEDAASATVDVDLILRKRKLGQRVIRVAGIPPRVRRMIMTVIRPPARWIRNRIFRRESQVASGEARMARL
jgi:SAM-dependent methyltransferase